jgi:NitT/TauT family transport system ATP-binding protein
MKLERGSNAATAISETMIAVHDLTFEYPDGTLVFERFNWQVASGEAWVVLGPSGCGKTTLLYLLAGLLPCDKGEILIAGQILERPRPRTGMILQDYGLLPWATVYQNVALGLRLRTFYGPDGKHVPPDETFEEIDTRVSPWLKKLRIDHLRDQYPSQLSGGQRQRVAIARTLSLDPDLLLMDEPFASLDLANRQALQDLVLKLRMDGQLTTITVTHTIEEAALLGNRILLLGNIPNRNPQTINNPGAGDGKYRKTDEYQRICAQLRQELERSK